MPMNIYSRRIFRHPQQHVFVARRTIADARPFREGDLVLLREARNRSAPPVFTRPLKPGRQIQSHKGIIWHEDIIGRRARDVVTSKLSSKKRTEDTGAPPKLGTEFRLHEVKLEDYVRLTKRLVTPIYSADAALIVDILDLHPGEIPQSYRGEGYDEADLQILEAGTGHGALTLYLSRAIHGANEHEQQIATRGGIEQRRAIIHTIEKKEKYSNHARSVVNGFKDGLYGRNVDFHVGDVGEWVRSAFTERNHRPFLRHAILDLPNAEAHLADVMAALRVDGTLVVFNPSLTQILTCVAKVKEQGLLLELDKVVELPSGGGAAGREWDVRPVRPRAAEKADPSAEQADEGEQVDPANVDDGEAAVREGGNVPGEPQVEDGEKPLDCGGQAASSEPESTSGPWQMVCRPKVGDRIVGGGFLGVFKKQRDRPTSL